MATKIGDVELGLVVNQQGFTNQLNGIQQKVILALRQSSSVPI